MIISLFECVVFKIKHALNKSSMNHETEKIRKRAVKISRRRHLDN